MTLLLHSRATTHLLHKQRAPGDSFSRTPQERPQEKRPRRGPQEETPGEDDPRGRLLERPCTESSYFLNTNFHDFLIHRLKNVGSGFAPYTKNSASGIGATSEPDLTTCGHMFDGHIYLVNYHVL